VRVIDVLNAPWAIVPEKYFELRAIYETHLRGEKIDIESIEARIGRPLKSEHQPYQMAGNVAVINIDGVMGKKMNLFTQISGGVSTEILGNDIAAAMDDPDVSAILLSIDSPGGTVDGTENLAAQIYASRGQKPIVALADGTMASAAYWIGSAADRVFVSDNSTQVGSIGVVATHEDYSRAEEKAGIKVTEIAAGKYKRIASVHEPLTQEGRATIQDKVDHIYSNFVATVAKHRGADPETVEKNMADGRIFLGQQAVKAGLADGVSTKAAQIADLQQRYAGRLHGAVSQQVRQSVGK
jgi:signal peptide peptidase SppA